MSESQQTIRRQPEPDQTRSAQTKTAGPNRLTGTAELRDSVTNLHQRTTALHEDVQSSTLDSRASQLAQSEAVDLLAILREEWGLSWECLARMLGVSSAAIRKWRRGEPISTENRHHLARVIAFCEMLGEVDPRVTDPAQWLEEPFLSATTLRACDLYAAGLLSQLLSVAAERTSREAMLDQFDPDWRDRYAADDGWSVERGGDGAPLIVKKG